MLLQSTRLVIIRRILPLSKRTFAQQVINRLSSPVSQDDRQGDLLLEIPKAWSEVDPAIVPHLRSCEPLPEKQRLAATTAAKDTGFHVYFLGTGSGSSDSRLSSCTLLRLEQEGILFDAGEGAQRYIRHSSVKLKKIQRILITHLHGDHVLGLPGILLGWNLDQTASTNASVSSETNSDAAAVIQVYGPPGLFNFITANLALTYSKINVKVEVYELLGGQVRTHWKQRAMLGSFPQFRHDNVIRKSIPCDENGIWTLKDFDDITRETNRLYDGTNFRIQAAEIHHIPGCQTFGYVVQEQTPPERINVERANQLGVKQSRKYQELKNGFVVETDDGRGQVRPDQVLVGTPFKARKLALLGDACAIPMPMRQLCQDADVLVHEATLDEKDRVLSVRRGHSTASMAGELAESVRAELLVLNHHKDAVLDTDQRRAREATRVIRGGTRVLSANDFMEIAVPRQGFRFLDQENPVESSFQCVHKQHFEEGLPGGLPVLAQKGALLPAMEDEAKTSTTMQTHEFATEDSFTFTRKL